jgi:hypothetical protein
MTANTKTCAHRCVLPVFAELCGNPFADHLLLLLSDRSVLVPLPDRIFLHFSAKCNEKRGIFCIFLLKIAEKEGKTDLSLWE